MKNYRVWKGYELLSNSNNLKCRICKETNPDWKEIGNEVDSEPYIHRICVFKMGHYGFTPEQYSAWRKSYNKVRLIVLKRDNDTCVKCDNNCWKCKLDLQEKGKIKINVHHIIPVRTGGTNHLDNLITVCQLCNRMLDNTRTS